MDMHLISVHFTLEDPVSGGGGGLISGSERDGDEMVSFALVLKN